MRRKRWIGWTAAALLAAGTASGGAAAAGKTADQPIRITLNGDPLAFDAAPVLLDGRVYVSFRPLFRQLGYAVEYDEATKRIRAKAADRMLEMTVGGTEALADGQAVPLDGQLRVIGGRAMIGVKLLGTLSSKQVEWLAQERTVAMKDPDPAQSRDEAISRLLDKLKAAEAAGDAETAAALIADDSPQKAELGEAQNDRDPAIEVAKTIVSREVEASTDQEVVWRTVEETKKVGGGFYPNRRSEIRYTFRAGTDGQWRIYAAETLSTAYTDLDALLSQPAALPAEDEKALRDVLDRQAAAANAEQIEDYLATMYEAEDPSREEAAEQLQQVFDEYDAKLTIERFVVADFNGSDRATLLYVATTELQAGDQTVRSRVTVANAARKENGRWLLEPEAWQLSNEQLSEAL